MRPEGLVEFIEATKRVKERRLPGRGTGMCQDPKSEKRCVSRGHGKSWGTGNGTRGETDKGNRALGSYWRFWVLF